MQHICPCLHTEKFGVPYYIQTLGGGKKIISEKRVKPPQLVE